MTRFGWRTEYCGVVSAVAAPTRSAARVRTLRSAKAAGFEGGGFVAVKAKRWSAYDAWAQKQTEDVGPFDPAFPGIFYGERLNEGARL